MMECKTKKKKTDGKTDQETLQSCNGHFITTNQQV